MSVFTILLLFLHSVLIPLQDTSLRKVRVNKNITLSIPGDFFPVPPEEIISKFISYRDPIAVFTSMNGETDLGINKSVSRWRESDIELMKSFYKSNLINLYDRVKFISNDSKMINNKEFVIFEFLATLPSDENSANYSGPVVKYIYVQYTIVKNEVYLFDLTAPAEQEEFWKPVARKIMDSVKIK